MIFRAALERKRNEIYDATCEIVKTVELDSNKFEIFKSNLMDEFGFIKDCKDELYSTPSITRCLLVIDKGSGDGILVNSEGDGFAMYSGFVPNAKSLLTLNKYPVFDLMMDKMTKLVDECIDMALLMHEDRELVIRKDDFARMLDSDLFNERVFEEMLLARPEVDYAEIVDGNVAIVIEPEYANKYSSKALTDRDIAVKCANHVLWLNEAGGEQADFSDCILYKADLARKELNGANFDGARLIECNLEETELCFGSCIGTKFSNCKMKNMTAEEAEFNEAEFLGCEMAGCVFTHSNFCDADMKACDLYNSSFRNCCCEGINLFVASDGQADTTNCCENEVEWLGEAEPFMHM